MLKGSDTSVLSGKLFALFEVQKLIALKYTVMAFGFMSLLLVVDEVSDIKE